MDTRLLDVLHDPPEIQVDPVVERIHIDLDGLVQELVDQHRMLRAGLGRPLDVVGEHRLVVDDLHASPTQHVRRPHEHRVADLGSDRTGLLGAAGQPVPGHRQSGLVQHLSERPALLGQVDRLRGRPQQRHTLRLQPSREPQRRLTTELTDDACHRTHRLFGRDDLEHVLECQRLEIEPVRGVVVGGHRLRVAVDHDRLEAGLAQRESRVHAAVVELDPLTDAVGSRAEDDDRLLVARFDFGLGVIAGVVVRRVRGELGRAGVHRLEHRPNAQGMADTSDHILAAAPQRRDLHVGEARLLGLAQQTRGEPVGRAHAVGHGVDADDLLEEPGIDRSDVVDLRDRGSQPQCLLHLLQTPVVRAPDLREQLLEGSRLLGPTELRALLFDAAQGLLQRLGEVAAQGHRLTDALHGRGQGVVGAGELLEGEPRDLHDDVVQRRFERGRCLAGDVVGDLVEGVPDREFGGDLRDRETGGLGGQRRTARDTGVHLDDDDPAVLGMQRELDVAATGVDAHLPDDRDPDVAHPLVLTIGEGQRRGHRDRVAGVHTERVEVLDRADHHDVVVAVAHEFELELLPAQDRLLEQNLRGRARGQTGTGDPAQILLVVGHPGPGAAHRERRADHHGIAEILDGHQTFIEGVTDRRACGLRAHLVHDLLEEFPVLPALDGVDVRTDEFHAVALEYAVFRQRHSRVQRGLSAEGGQQRIGALLLDDLFDHLGGDRLDVGGVGELRVGHDRRRVAVDQHDPQPFGLEDPARLGAGVVELARLPDHDRSGADDQHAGDVGALGHQRPPCIASANLSNR